MATDPPHGPDLASALARLTMVENAAGDNPAARKFREHGAQLDLLARASTVLDETVKALSADVERLKDAPGTQYKIPPTPPWHQLDSTTRAETVERLRQWVDLVFVPTFGHLAAKLGPCWAEHLLALQILDLLAEAWAWLYLREGRSWRILSGQVDYAERIVPQAVELLRAETQACGRHRQQPRAAS
jgi:hypothetical protein